jgi:hypothetical protein
MKKGRAMTAMRSGDAMATAYQEGFTHKGRRVFALRYRLECAPPQIMELIVPLDPNGDAIGTVRPVDPHKRIVQVHPGDKINLRGTEYSVQAVEVFRSLPLAVQGHC